LNKGKIVADANIGKAAAVHTEVSANKALKLLNPKK
jgi:hypothetical protein